MPWYKVTLAFTITDFVSRLSSISDLVGIRRFRSPVQPASDLVGASEHCKGKEIHRRRDDVPRKWKTFFCGDHRAGDGDEKQEQRAENALGISLAAVASDRHLFSSLKSTDRSGFCRDRHDHTNTKRLSEQRDGSIARPSALIARPSAIRLTGCLAGRSLDCVVYTISPILLIVYIGCVHQVRFTQVSCTLSPVRGVISHLFYCLYVRKCTRFP